MGQADPASEGAVVSITQLSTGTGAVNVIPSEVKIGGTLRSLTLEGFARLQQRFEEVVVASAGVFRCKVSL